MFTGIVQAVGKIVRLAPLEIDCGGLDRRAGTWGAPAGKSSARATSAACRPPRSSQLLTRRRLPSVGVGAVAGAAWGPGGCTAAADCPGGPARDTSPPSDEPPSHTANLT